MNSCVPFLLAPPRHLVKNSEGMTLAGSISSMATCRWLEGTGCTERVARIFNIPAVLASQERSSQKKMHSTLAEKVRKLYKYCAFCEDPQFYLFWRWIVRAPPTWTESILHPLSCSMLPPSEKSHKCTSLSQGKLLLSSRISSSIIATGQPCRLGVQWSGGGLEPVQEQSMHSQLHSQQLF